MTGDLLAMLAATLIAAIVVIKNDKVRYVLVESLRPRSRSRGVRLAGQTWGYDEVDEDDFGLRNLVLFDQMGERVESQLGPAWHVFYNKSNRALTGEKLSDLEGQLRLEIAELQRRARAASIPIVDRERQTGDADSVMDVMASLKATVGEGGTVIYWRVGPPWSAAESRSRRESGDE